MEDRLNLLNHFTIGIKPKSEVLFPKHGELFDSSWMRQFEPEILNILSSSKALGTS